MKPVLKLAQLFMAITVLFCGVSSCCKVVRISSFKYVNASGHSLSVALYLGGKLQTQYGFELLDLGSIFPFGDKNSGGSIPDALLDESDSTIVKFDDGKIATHYNAYERSDQTRTIPLAGKNPNALLSDNPRGLYNEGGYVPRDMGKRSRCSRYIETTFTFTKDDYLNAK